MTDHDPAPPAVRRRRTALPWWLVLPAFVVLGVVAFPFWYLATRPVNGIRVDDLRSQIETELPLGSPSTEIESWFRDHGFDNFTEIRDIDRNKSGYQAIISNDTMFEKANIVIVCQINRAEELVGISVERVPRFGTP